VFIRVAALSAGRESTNASQEPEEIQLKEKPGESPAEPKASGKTKEAAATA